MVRKIPGKELWEVKSKTGERSFGTYRSKEKALERLVQIERFKHMDKWKKKD